MTQEERKFSGNWFLRTPYNSSSMKSVHYNGMLTYNGNTLVLPAYNGVLTYNGNTLVRPAMYIREK